MSVCYSDVSYFSIFLFKKIIEHLVNSMDSRPLIVFMSR